MTRIKFLFIKNKELLIYLILFIAHASYTPVYYFMEREINASLHNDVNNLFNYPLFIYNLVAAICYGCFLCLFKFFKNRFFFILCFLEILVYSAFLTIMLGADFGLQSCVICLIPSLFLTAFTSKNPGKYYIILSLIAMAANILILYWDFSRSASITLKGYYWVVKKFPVFYVVHTASIYFASSTLLLYFSIHTEQSLTRAKKKYEQNANELDFMSNHDHLTGLVNRRKINFYLTQCDYRKRNEKKDYAFVIFDIDNFKKVNDTYGHDAGDFILTNVTSKIQQYIKPGQLFGRWGGEEFVILYNDFSKEILNELSEIRQAIENTDNIWKGKNIRITLTFGLSSSKTARNPDKLIIEADNNLMEGKQNGKNQIVFTESFR